MQIFVLLLTADRKSKGYITSQVYSFFFLTKVPVQTKYEKIRGKTEAPELIYVITEFLL